MKIYCRVLLCSCVIFFCTNDLRKTSIVYSQIIKGFKRYPPTLIRISEGSKREDLFHLEKFDTVVKSPDPEHKIIEQDAIDVMVKYILEKLKSGNNPRIMVGLNGQESNSGFSLNHNSKSDFEDSFERASKIGKSRFSESIVTFKSLKKLGMMIFEVNQSIKSHDLEELVQELWENTENVWIIEADSEVKFKAGPSGVWRTEFSPYTFFINLAENSFRWFMAPFSWIFNTLNNFQQGQQTFQEKVRSIPNDPQFHLQWGLNNDFYIDTDVNAPEFWELSNKEKKSEVTVALIDTGVDIAHPELRNKIWVNKDEIANNGIDDDGNGYIDDVHGWNFLENTNNLMDFEGHGTHCAGILASSKNNGLGTSGIFGDCKIMPLKFGNLISQVIEAINYSLDKGIRISSNSWGYNNYSPLLYIAMERTKKMGQLFFVAVDNAGKDNNYFDDYPPNWNFENMINVAALSQDGNLAHFSNYGSPIVHIAAPGHNIYSTLPHSNYGYKSGTSMATPLVAGVAAAILSSYPNINNNDLKQILFTSAKKFPSLKGLLLSEGSLNAYKAYYMASKYTKEEKNLKSY